MIPTLAIQECWIVLGYYGRSPVWFGFDGSMGPTRLWADFANSASCPAI
ncbi:hypothetical protein [Shinella sp.]